MRRPGALALLLAAGCAHGGAPGQPAAPPALPPEPVALLEVQGLDDPQGRVVEAAVCQGLVEAHRGDVTCPDTVRASASALSVRGQLGDDTGDQSRELIQQVAAAPRRVLAEVEQPAPNRLVLHLRLLRVADQQVVATRDLEAADFDELLARTPGEARALLR